MDKGKTRGLNIIGREREMQVLVTWCQRETKGKKESAARGNKRQKAQVWEHVEGLRQET